MVKKMTPIERAKALTMLGMGVSIREVARKMGRSKGAIHAFKEKAKVKKAKVTDFATACKQSPGQGRKKIK